MKTKLPTLTAFASGLVFGIGLIFAGMTDPSKVIGFLDLAGNWDPSLALVMAGAILIGVFAFRAAKRRGISLLGHDLRLPINLSIDKPLLIGSLLFIGMVAGMAVFEFVMRMRAGSPDGSAVENLPE